MNDNNSNVLKAKKMINQIVNKMDGKDINWLIVKDSNFIADYIAIVTVISGRQSKAIVNEIKLQAKKLGINIYGIEGIRDNLSNWILVDMEGIILHIMSPEMREYYDLEGIWQ